MHGARVAFDSSLPAVVASFDLVLGPKRLKRGDALPWREMNVSEFDLLQLYLAQQVDFVSPLSAAPAALPAATVQAAEAAAVSELECLTAPAGYAAGGSYVAPGGGPDALPLSAFEAGPKIAAPSPKAKRRGRSR